MNTQEGTQESNTQDHEKNTYNALRPITMEQVEEEETKSRVHEAGPGSIIDPSKESYKDMVFLRDMDRNTKLFIHSAGQMMSMCDKFTSESQNIISMLLAEMDTNTELQKMLENRSMQKLRSAYISLLGVKNTMQLLCKKIEQKHLDIHRAAANGSMRLSLGPSGAYDMLGTLANTEIYTSGHSRDTSSSLFEVQSSKLNAVPNVDSTEPEEPEDTGAMSAMSAQRELFHLQDLVSSTLTSGERLNTDSAPTRSAPEYFGQDDFRPASIDSEVSSPLLEPEAPPSAQSTPPSSPPTERTTSATAAKDRSALSMRDFSSSGPLFSRTQSQHLSGEAEGITADTNTTNTNTTTTTTTNNNNSISSSTLLPRQPNATLPPFRLGSLYNLSRGVFTHTLTVPPRLSVPTPISYTPDTPSFLLSTSALAAPALPQSPH